MVIKSNILKDGELIPYVDWCEYIESLKASRASKEITDEAAAESLIKGNIESAIKERMPKQRFGIFFSGGVDSTLIAFFCKKFSADFICYTVGIEGSKDIEWSSRIAQYYKFPHKTKVLTLNEMERLFERTAKILGKDLINIVNIGVGAVVLAAIELAKEDNIKIFFGGIGSEEIFAGYMRHEKAKDINKECWSGLKTTWSRDFQRDYKIVSATGIEVLTPFLDPKLIISAMDISGDLKIKKDIKKYILRKAALLSGLKEEFAFRKKIAAQYGSSFDKAIERISRKHGFKYKKEYLDYLSCLK